jgi:hypothetical protein
MTKRSMLAKISWLSGFWMLTVFGCSVFKWSLKYTVNIWKMYLSLFWSRVSVLKLNDQVFRSWPEINDFVRISGYGVQNGRQFFAVLTTYYVLKSGPDFK